MQGVSLHPISLVYFANNEDDGVRQNPLTQQDYRYRLAHNIRPIRLNRTQTLILLGSLALFSLVVAVLPQRAGALRSPISNSSSEVPASLPLPSSFLDEPALPFSPAPAESTVLAPDLGKVDEPQWQTLRVKPGDNLAALFSRAGVEHSELQKVLALKNPALRRIYPGESLRFQVDSTGLLQAFHYVISPEQELRVSRDNSGFNAELITLALDRKTSFAVGTIDSSLFAAAQRSGLPDRLTMELAEIFNYDIDFALDIRQGDSFGLVYEQIYKDGEKIRDGNILAAEFTNEGKTYRAIRLDQADGQAQYYTPEGYALRKAFLRTPVEFSRISSTFSSGRRHPILNRIRAHKGVDYAAPVGTPIRATGNGKVIFRGSKGGYGNTIVLQHGAQFTTLYAHMSRFAGGVRAGTKVQQGQIIGYVGQTGLASGPHLHYEFRINDVHRDPLKVKFPAAQPIAADAKEAFERMAQERIAQLLQYKQDTQYAADTRQTETAVP